jgi:hypothetical protein
MCVCVCDQSRDKLSITPAGHTTQLSNQHTILKKTAWNLEILNMVTSCRVLWSWNFLGKRSNHQLKNKPCTWLRLQTKLYYNNHTNLVISKALLDKFTVARRLKKSPAIYATHVNRVLHWSIICVTSIHSTPSHNFRLISILLISCRLCPGLPTDIYPSALRFLISHAC